MTEELALETDATQEKVGFSSVLAHRDFRYLWVGQVVSNIGTAISYLALIFFVYDLTESPMAMAILAMAQTIPTVAFAGHVGVYVDRWDRKQGLLSA